MLLSFSCSGSLKIYYYDQSKTPTFAGIKILTMPNRRKGYRNLTRKLLKRNHVVVKVEVEGTCCWKVYSDTFFAGQRQNLKEGYQGDLDFTIKSAKIENCL